MSQITEAFQKGKAFIPFITCGDPTIETTKQIVRAMADAGADIIELGIPFSDPTAEGPVIQEANERALRHGITTDDVFEMVRDLRKDLTVPLVVMTYANVVFSYGTEKFIATCADVGVQGMILPDVPFEEKADFQPLCRAHGIDFISMVAPTSKARIEMIAKEAEGFLYVVSSLGVTGTRSQIDGDVASIIRLARTCTNTPCAIGFGVSTPAQAAAMAQISDGVIVGSAIVKIAARNGEQATAPIAQFVKDMKAAISSPPASGTTL